MDFHYSNFVDDELLDETDQIKAIAKKTWLSTASTSLANLEKVQTNIYNVGLIDPKDLKATNLRTKRAGQPLSSTVNTEIGTDRSSIQSGTLNAWGSNTSIPDSVHQYGNNMLPKPTRPASAKVNNRIRPPSGRKPRPQSAKEPLPNGVVSEQAFGGICTEMKQWNEDGKSIIVPSVKRPNMMPQELVKGAKYDPSGRPPKGVPNTSSMGWVGPPAGLKYPDRPPDGVAWQMDLPVEDDDVSTDLNTANYRAVNHEAPPPPHASPAPPSPEPEERTKRVFELFIGDPYKVPEDADMLESSDDEDLFDQPSPRDNTPQSVNHTDEHTHKDVNHFESHTLEKESLRLSLPIADDDYDETDDMDTERLLLEAESVSKKFDLKNIISANKNIPSSTEEEVLTNESGLSNEKSQKADVSEEIEVISEVESSNKEKAKELVSEIITETGLQFEKSGKSDKKVVLERDKSAVTFNEDVTTVNITPRNIGRKVEELHHNKRKPVHHTTDNFVDLIEIKNRVEPVLSTGKAELSQRDVKSSPRGVTKPPPGKTIANGSAKFNELNLRRTRTDVSAVNAKSEQAPSTCNRSHSSHARPRSASVPLNRVAKPITMVTVDYGEVEKSENEKMKKESKKRKERKRKEDVETMMQKLGLEGEGNTETVEAKANKEKKETVAGEAMVDMMSAPTVCKSEHEKNYYEISRHSSMSNITKKVERDEKLDLSGTLSRENTVFKTTKTLEFDAVEPKEVSVKSVIDPNMVSTKEKERFLATSPDIKHRKPPSRPSSAKPPVAKKTVTSDDLERPGSRLGFVAMAPDQAPDDKEDTSAKNMRRPGSAPLYRRPRSALKDKENKTQTQTNKSEDRQKKMTEREKEEREKVIDNLLERTRCLTDKEQEVSEGTEDTVSQRPAVEKKKPRPFSAHAGPLSRFKEATVKTTCNKRPSSAVNSVHKHYAAYSRAGSATSSKTKKSASKTRVVLTEPCIINTNTSYFEEETEEDIACQKMEKELAEKGVHVSAATLQRALYPPSGKSRYYQITANLPQKSSLSLLSHPKVWLPEEHKRLQKATKTLEKANEMMYLQEKAEKRRAYLASLTPEQRKKLKKKGKKGGKKSRKTHSAV